jgi:hypothetical protein|uniref:Holin n=1 Tax=Siphoviridae sp. ctj6w2 TaxID=2827919 RepID=A0A8S5T8I9_9CAUD|nr:MAG TPA: holin [Siphoviridae sp. ctj6w2]DAK23678.1 MAG TPA: holin [Caudoviricetes sp.]
MNEIILNIISVVVTAVILPLISYAGARLIAWLNAKIKDENAKQQLTVATDIVMNAVRSVFQTYVETLKKNGAFDKESQKVALIKAKDDALAQMSDEIKDYITKNYGDLETWITTQIESTINILKNK